MAESFDLRVVPLRAVVPHEEADPRRVERLVARLEADGSILNPPVVAASAEDLVLLDGATRLAALRELGYEHVIVQFAAPDRLRLETWSHVILDVAPNRLLDVLGRVEGVVFEESAGDDDAGDAPIGDDDDGDGDGGAGGRAAAMCSVALIDGRTFAVRPEGDRHPFTALNPLVAAYLGVAPIARTTDVELTSALADRPGAVALVVFPRLTVDTVFAAARAGHRLPAGITRFIVAGRVISLNAPLAALRGGGSLAEHNRWLEELIAARRAAGRIRHYPEAVFVLDD